MTVGTPLKRYARSATMALYPALPAPAKRIAAAIDVAIARRPRVYVDDVQHPRARLPRGAVTISVDFEMAWGWQYALARGTDRVRIGLHERAQVPRILTVMDELHVPATWATVGHLFLESCHRDASGLPHGSLPRPGHFRTPFWGFDSGDWYQHDPCTDVRRSPAWYAPDLIARVISAKARHEIGCHTFSHVGFGGYCSREVAAGEIDACAGAMASFGLTPLSWVFPGNEGGHYDLLAAAGVRMVRLFPVPGDLISLPVRGPEGLWWVPVSSALERGRTWSVGQRLDRLKGFVDAAGEERLSMHLWFHPSLSDGDLDGVLIPLLRYAVDRRDKGLIDILTMRGLVESTAAARAAGERRWP